MAGNAPEMVIYEKIRYYDGQKLVKKYKIVEIDSRSKTGRRQAHVSREVFFFTSIYDLRCGQK